MLSTVLALTAIAIIGWLGVRGALLAAAPDARDRDAARLGGATALLTCLVGIAAVALLATRQLVLARELHHLVAQGAAAQALTLFVIIGLMLLFALALVTVRRVDDAKESTPPRADQLPWIVGAAIVTAGASLTWAEVRIPDPSRAVAPDLFSVDLLHPLPFLYFAVVLSEITLIGLEMYSPRLRLGIAAGIVAAGAAYALTHPFPLARDAAWLWGALGVAALLALAGAVAQAALARAARARLRRDREATRPRSRMERWLKGDRSGAEGPRSEAELSPWGRLLVLLLVVATPFFLALWVRGEAQALVLAVALTLLFVLLLQTGAHALLLLGLVLVDTSLLGILVHLRGLSLHLSLVLFLLGAAVLLEAERVRILPPRGARTASPPPPAEAAAEGGGEGDAGAAPAGGRLGRALAWLRTGLRGVGASLAAVLGLAVLSLLAVDLPNAGRLLIGEVRVADAAPLDEALFRDLVVEELNRLRADAALVPLFPPTRRLGPYEPLVVERLPIRQSPEELVAASSRLTLFGADVEVALGALLAPLRAPVRWALRVRTVELEHFTVADGTHYVSVRLPGGEPVVVAGDPLALVPEIALRIFVDDLDGAYVTGTGQAKDFREGLHAARGGELEHAQALLAGLVTEAPGFELGRYRLAQVLYERGETRESDRLLRGLIDERRPRATAHIADLLAYHVFSPAAGGLGVPLLPAGSSAGVEGSGEALRLWRTVSLYAPTAERRLSASIGLCQAATRAVWEERYDGPRRMAPGLRHLILRAYFDCTRGVDLARRLPPAARANPLVATATATGLVGLATLLQAVSGHTVALDRLTCEGVDYELLTGRRAELVTRRLLPATQRYAQDAFRIAPDDVTFACAARRFEALRRIPPGPGGAASALDPLAPGSLPGVAWAASELERPPSLTERLSRPPSPACGLEHLYDDLAAAPTSALVLADRRYLGQHLETIVERGARKVRAYLYAGATDPLQGFSVRDEAFYYLRMAAEWYHDLAEAFPDDRELVLAYIDLVTTWDAVARYQVGLLEGQRPATLEALRPEPCHRDIALTWIDRERDRSPDALDAALSAKAALLAGPADATRWSAALAATAVAADPEGRWLRAMMQACDGAEADALATAEEALQASGERGSRFRTHLEELGGLEALLRCRGPSPGAGAGPGARVE